MSTSVSLTRYNNTKRLLNTSFTVINIKLSLIGEDFDIKNSE